MTRTRLSWPEPLWSGSVLGGWSRAVTVCGGSGVRRSVPDAADLYRHRWTVACRKHRAGRGVGDGGGHRHEVRVSPPGASATTCGSRAPIHHQSDEWRTARGGGRQSRFARRVGRIHRRSDRPRAHDGERRQRTSRLDPPRVRTRTSTSDPSATGSSPARHETVIRVRFVLPGGAPGRRVPEPAQDSVARTATTRETQQVKVITSGGFKAAFNILGPMFRAGHPESR